MAHEIFRLHFSFTQTTGMRQATTILVFFVSKEKATLFHSIRWRAALLQGLEVQPRILALALRLIEMEASEYLYLYKVPMSVISFSLSFLFMHTAPVTLPVRTSKTVLILPVTRPCSRL